MTSRIRAAYKVIDDESFHHTNDGTWQGTHKVTAKNKKAPTMKQLIKGKLPTITLIFLATGLLLILPNIH
ncbi:hypothetical protein ACFSB1_09200 [Halopseudomonas phragmitis]|uniref:hypothetical protein n=1 Tax=Pseudomonadaceae TaxID=135621 RepID=UPI0010331C50|nr:MULTISPECIES: hypothetical protein [Pseudomonadaceae]